MTFCIQALVCQLDSLIAEAFCAVHYVLLRISCHVLYVILGDHVLAGDLRNQQPPGQGCLSSALDGVGSLKVDNVSWIYCSMCFVHCVK